MDFKRDFCLQIFLGYTSSLLRTFQLSEVQHCLRYKVQMRRSAGLLLKLMSAVDECIPEPIGKLAKPFLMPIEDLFSIQVKGHRFFFYLAVPV